MLTQFEAGIPVKGVDKCVCIPVITDKEDEKYYKWGQELLKKYLRNHQISIKGGKAVHVKQNRQWRKSRHLKHIYTAIGFTEWMAYKKTTIDIYYRKA